LFWLRFFLPEIAALFGSENRFKTGYLEDLDFQRI